MTHQPNDTIVSIARQRAAKHPDRKYIIFLTDGEEQEEILTYGELDRTAKQVACWLSENGVNKGDRALTILPNSLAFNQVFFGCLYGGVLAVPLSEPAGPKQMRSYLETFVPTVKTAKPKILITTPILVEFLKNGLPDELVDLFAGIKIVTAEAVLNEEVTSKDLPLLQPADLAYLQFTSGSTGTPKGIMIAHCNVMANMAQARVSCQWEEEKGTGLWLPLFHDFGLAAGMIGALFWGFRGVDDTSPFYCQTCPLAQRHFKIPLCVQLCPTVCLRYLLSKGDGRREREAGSLLSYFRNLWCRAGPLQRCQGVQRNLCRMRLKQNSNSTGFRNGRNRDHVFQVQRSQNPLCGSEAA